MPRPLRKAHRLQLAVSTEDLCLLKAMAAGRPLGPAIVTAALRPPPTLEATWTLLEHSVMNLSVRRSPMAKQAVTALAQLRQAFR